MHIKRILGVQNQKIYKYIASAVRQQTPLSCPIINLILRNRIVALLHIGRPDARNDQLSVTHIMAATVGSFGEAPTIKDKLYSHGIGSTRHLT